MCVTINTECMQHNGFEEGIKEGQNVDEACVDAQPCMQVQDPSNNIKTLDTKEHHANTKVVQS